MSEALFISDLHVGAPDDPRARLFAQFLDRCHVRPPSHLFLVGDVFDLWIADRRWFVNRYADLIAKIRRLKEAGCEIHYFEGNHDLDLEPFWSRTLGVITHAKPALVEVHGRHVWIEHGDQMDPLDRGYHFLRWLLRTPFVRALGRHLPDRIVRWIGERASQLSRRYTTEVRSTNDEKARAMQRDHVAELARTHTFEIFVAGHVHVNEDTVINGVRVYNLGTWLKTPMVLTVGVDRSEMKPL